MLGVLGRDIGRLDGSRLFTLGQFLLEQGFVGDLQLAGGLVGLLGDFVDALFGRAADFAQHLVVERAGTYRQVGTFEVFLADDFGVALLENALDGVGVARRAVVAGDCFDDFIRGAGLAIGQLLVQNDAALGLNGIAFALEAGAVDLDALAGLGRDGLPGRRGRNGPWQGGQQAGDDQVAHLGSLIFPWISAACRRYFGQILQILSAVCHSLHFACISSNLRPTR
jgi:hypothetical protein